VRVLLPGPTGVPQPSVRSDGAPTEVGEGTDLAHLLDRLYDVARPVPAGRPFLLANMVSGLDGSLTHGGRVGTLSSPTDRRLFVHLRGLVDAVVVGAGTARAEGYGPVRLPDEVQATRAAAGRPPVPPVVVVSRSLDLDPSAPLFHGSARTVVLTARSSPTDRRRALADVADVLVAGDESVDLVAGSQALREQGIGVALTEGGPTLLAELVDADLLDELCLTLTPVLGGDPVTMAVPTLLPRPLTEWALVSAAAADSELYLRYSRTAEEGDR